MSLRHIVGVESVLVRKCFSEKAFLEQRGWIKYCNHPPEFHIPVGWAISNSEKLTQAQIDKIYELTKEVFEDVNLLGHYVCDVIFLNKKNLNNRGEFLKLRDALNAFYTNRESWLSHTSFSFIKKIVQFSITELDLNFNIKENLTPRQIILYGLDELETVDTPS